MFVDVKIQEPLECAVQRVRLRKEATPVAAQSQASGIQVRRGHTSANFCCTMAKTAARKFSRVMNLLPVREAAGPSAGASTQFL